MNANIPAHIGRYQIQRKLDEGGMAEVFLAYDPHVNREVAIKLIHSRMAADPELKRRFLQEARSLAALEHSAIVPIYDYGEQDDKPYFVMRYMSGGSLQDRLVGGVPPLNETVRILQRIAGALDIAHDRKIIHRDIKPSNILFDPHNDPYIADFGIAKLVQDGTGVAGGVGGTTMYGGTPKYMSPEQCRGEMDLDRRSDVYALGITLYEMLVGATPFESDTAYGYIYLHVNQPPPPITTVRPDLPVTLDGVLRQALVKERHRRYPTASAFSTAVWDVVRDLPPLQPLSATVPKLSPTPIPRSKPPSTPVNVEPPQEVPVNRTPTPRAEPFASTIAKPVNRSVPPPPSPEAEAQSVLPTSTPPSRQPLYLGIAGGVIVLLLIIGAFVAFSQNNQNNDNASAALTGNPTDSTSPPMTETPSTSDVGATTPTKVASNGAAAASRPTPAPPSALQALIADFTSSQMSFVGQPAAGELANEPTLVALSVPAPAVQDFVATARFTNPAGALWSYGFLFRDATGGDNYRLFITNGREWYLLLQDDFAVDPNFTTVATGSLPEGVVVDAGTQNTLTVAAQGPRGRFWINDELVTDLDLSANIEISPLFVGAFFFGDDQADPVPYDNFSVWRLR